MLSAIVTTISLVASIADAPITKSRSAAQLAVDARQWDTPGVRDYLDGLSVDELRDVIGEPEIVTAYAAAPGWEAGIGRPRLADESPAVQQAIAYCAAIRARRRMGGKVVRQFDAALGGAAEGIHPVTCAWCDEGDADIWEAVGWSVMVSRYVVREFAIWEGAVGHQAYLRSTGRAGEYDNPRHRLFWGQPQKDRRYELDQVLKAARSTAAVPA